jgi:hypothetical protein
MPASYQLGYVFSLIHLISKFSNNRCWYIIVVFNEFVKEVKEPAVLWPERAETSSSSKTQRTAQHWFGPELGGCQLSLIPSGYLNSRNRPPPRSLLGMKNWKFWVLKKDGGDSSESRGYMAGYCSSLYSGRNFTKVRVHSPSVNQHPPWYQGKNPQNPFKLFLNNTPGLS